MKKILLIAIAMLAALMSTVAFAPTASAYPEVTCTVDVTPVNPKAGETITVEATLTVFDNGGRLSAARKAAAEDTTWTVTFNGQTKTGSGAQFTTQFIAPNVSKSTTYNLRVESDNPDGTCVRNVAVVVSPDAASQPPAGAGLPNTGGPQLWILIAGLALVLAGAYSVRQSRRRHA